MDLLIFWNHVGREHGGLEYTDDIRKNSPEIVQQCLHIKEQRCINTPFSRFIRYNESILLELPLVNSDRKYLIVYYLENGLQFSLNFKSKSKYSGWVIDIVDIVEIKPNVFCVYDLFIDIAVHEDGRYEVLDIDEYETALSLNVMTKEQISKSLKSFHTALSLLHTKPFPDTLLMELVDTYM